MRTSEPAADLSAEDAVRAYKSLEQVEQAFRCLKTLDLARAAHSMADKRLEAASTFTAPSPM